MKKILLLSALCGLLSACDAMEAMKATKDVPKKMKTTNENMKKMIEGMDHTNKAVDKQAKLIPFENLLKPEYTKILSPMPTDLMPFGKELALVISAEDLIDLTYLWLKGIDENYPEKSVDRDGNEVPYSDGEIITINHEKMARLTILQIICGFAPQEVIDQVISRQIIVGENPEESLETDGRFEETAYAILMLRAQFLNDIMLDASLLAKPLNNPGKVAEAVKYAKAIDFIAKLEFVDKIGYETHGFLPAEANVKEYMKPALALQKWNKIKKSAERDAYPIQSKVAKDPVRNEKVFQFKLNQYNQAMTTIQQYIDSWTPTLN